ncbi:MAG: DUF6120 family protein [Bacilli bacterium]|nr:DUF6120 family protein [Bacilli bacterium]
MMNKRLKSELNHYIKSVKSEINCSSNLKLAFISEFKQRILEFLNENPECNINDVIQEFGSPQQISKGFESQVNIEKLKKQAKKYFYIKIVAFVLLILLVVSCIFLIGMLGNLDGYIVVSDPHR